MSAFTVAATHPAPTGEEVLANLQRLLRPTKIRFSPAITSGVAVAVHDGDERIVVCSWEDREAVRAALRDRLDSRFVLDESSIA